MANKDSPQVCNFPCDATKTCDLVLSIKYFLEHSSMRQLIIYKSIAALEMAMNSQVVTPKQNDLKLNELLLKPMFFHQCESIPVCFSAQRQLMQANHCGMTEYYYGWQNHVPNVKATIDFCGCSFFFFFWSQVLMIKRDKACCAINILNL